MSAVQDGVIPIRVLIRVRPLSKKERSENAGECIRSHIEQNQISCNDKMFAFDAVFDPACSQDDVYLASAGVLIDKLFTGYNCTILAYGQTGSGKTHTMGTEDTTVTMFSETRGIVPRIVSRIFEIIGESEQPGAYNVCVSMTEVYDDKVIDLLSMNPSREGLLIREKNGVPFVQGLSSHTVNCLDTTMNTLMRGCSLRSKGETAMNMLSSRSHAIVTITIKKRAVPTDDRVWEAKLRLVDLAGSERIKNMPDGDRKKEGIKINEGLYTLGKVIKALSTEEKHIPYRDSKITRLLQDSLGGSSYTVMIACVSPVESNGVETLSTLRYAHRVKSIKNKPIVQVDPTKIIIQKLRDENASLREEMKSLRDRISVLQMEKDVYGKLSQTDEKRRREASEKEMEKLKKDMEEERRNSERLRKERVYALEEELDKERGERKKEKEEMLKLSVDMEKVKKTNGEATEKIRIMLVNMEEERSAMEKMKKEMEEERRNSERLLKERISALEEELDKERDERRKDKEEMNRNDRNFHSMDNLIIDDENHLKREESEENNDSGDEEGTNDVEEETSEESEDEDEEDDMEEESSGEEEVSDYEEEKKRVRKERKTPTSVDQKKRSPINNKGSRRIRQCKLISDNDIHCIECPYYTRNVNAWRFHLRDKHQTTARSSGLMLQCQSCNAEFVSEYGHPNKCNARDFEIIRKTSEEFLKTPKCLFPTCDMLPRSAVGYAHHLQRRHQTSLKEPDCRNYTVHKK